MKHAFVRTVLRACGPATLCVLALVMSGMSGCGRNTAPVDATRALQEAFQTAAPDVQQAIQTVNHHLRAGDYTAAARSLAPVALERPLSAQERQAVAQALEQINRGVAANPAQDTREMYELRAKLFQAIHRGGPRF